MGAEQFGSGEGIGVCVEVVVSSEAGKGSCVASSGVLDVFTWHRDAWPKEQSVPIRKKRWLREELRC